MREERLARPVVHKADDSHATPHRRAKPPAECGCRLAAVRRDLGHALRVLAELESRLPSDAELAAASLSHTEAERLDRYCLNVKVSLDELQRWSRLLTGSAESLAGRTPPGSDA